jgi:thiol-disulfide isomerase/thioredoxin
MNLETTTPAQSTENTPQARVAAHLGHASQLSQRGKVSEAATELEDALAEARAVPYEIQFETRVQLAMTLADVYSSLGEISKASEMLREESAFAEKISQIMRLTGTPSQKRAATSGSLQVRDRATQMALLGKLAPEISVKDWIIGKPLTLAELRGRVVLLEFWATWCKPCQEMFPKLKSLYDEQAASGLEIVALTRHYLAYRGTSQSMTEEVQLIRKMVNEHEIGFPVGIAEDERLQAIYGANGLPTTALIDRHGVVRYVGPGIDDRGFDEALQRCLQES